MKDKNENIPESNMPKTYNPKEWEEILYREWESSGYFNPDECVQKGIADKDAPAFSVILPPPNATGTLHVGHSVMLAIQDTIIRYRRMKGDRALWLPGTDHAALATHEKVERILWEEEKKTRHDIGRDSFIQKIHAFVENSRSVMTGQMRAMGASLDWSREAFTLDDERNFAVRTAFKRMYDDGIIYRGDRIVNWDPKMQTTVSDDEIEWKEEVIPFYYFQYGPFVIGTSRPETKFGDKYVVVHPDDKRYKEYAHGQKFEVEWIGGTVTATLIKDAIVDKDFGSGAMTITPWHDATDFDIAERHNLSKEQVIGYDGKILPIAGKEFEGLNIFEARQKIVEKLASKGLLVRIEEGYTHNIAVNSRGGGIIEPQIKRQWFVGVNREFERDGKKTTLKKLMQEAVRSGDIRIIPKRFEKVYFHWIDNLRDWCISRQIWYGHRIPVWYKGDVIYCEIEPPKEEGWEQDPDTLDTWFSSGLWTFSTLGWPNETNDFKTFHPTSFMETAYDILFFWVARMILMSTYLLDEVPFKTVYMHGLVRDEKGQKMSKSIGNVIDPRDVIEKFGTDAVRLSLLIGSTPGNDARLGEKKIQSFRNFTNKLWNIGRYVSIQNTDKKQDHSSTLSDADTWIISQLQKTTLAITSHLEQYQFSLAGEMLRDFTWNNFADWYVEVHKIEKNDALLSFVFREILKLWHPFMPFVTEALYQTLYSSETSKKFLMVESWPKTDTFPHQSPEDETRSKNFTHTIALISSIRALRAFYRIDPGKKLFVTIFETGNQKMLVPQHILEQIGRTEILEIVSEEPNGKGCALIGFGNTKIYIHLNDVLDIPKEQSRIKKEIVGLEQHIIQAEKRLENTAYISKAPKHIVEQTREQLDDLRRQVSEKQHFQQMLSL